MRTEASDEMTEIVESDAIASPGHRLTLLDHPTRPLQSQTDQIAVRRRTRKFREDAGKQEGTHSDISRD